MCPADERHLARQGFTQGSLADKLLALSGNRREHHLAGQGIANVKFHGGVMYNPSDSHPMLQYLQGTTLVGSSQHTGTSPK